MTQHIIAFGLLILLAAIAIADAALAWHFGPDATISRVIVNLSRAYPIIPLLAGVVLGHLFWPQG